MTVSALRSFVSTVHVPLPRFVPSLSCQPDGTPGDSDCDRSPSAADGLASAKLMGLPATPAGPSVTLVTVMATVLVTVLLLLMLLVSVVVTVRLSEP